MDSMDVRVPGMFNPVIKKSFVSILLCLLYLLVSSPVEARLTLGVVVGTNEAAGEITSVQARSLASLLGEELQEEVVVKELPDAATLINELNSSATLDLALLATKDVQANLDRFPPFGRLDEYGEFHLISRPDVNDELPQDVARIVVKARPELSAPVGNQQNIIAEALTFAEVTPAEGMPGTSPVTVDENLDKLPDSEIIALLGEYTVADVVSQPDIPPELRPPGLPIVRPGRATRPARVAEDKLLVASMPEPRKQIAPASPPKLLPEPEPEPGIIYVMPFVAVMVPGEVSARIFDQFIDSLNQGGEALGLQFVILKQGLKSAGPEWLAVRRYVTGEIYAYVEDFGSSRTEIRSKARVAYRLPHQEVPVFSFEYPVRSFFDHDRSTIDIERIKLADDISATLASELLKAL